MHNRCCHWYAVQRTTTTSQVPGKPILTVGPVLTFPELDGSTSLIVASNKCFSVQQCSRWEKLIYGSTLSSRLCHANTEAFLRLKTTSQLLRPDSACFRLQYATKRHWFAIEKLLPLIWDRRGTPPLPQELT